MTALAKRSAAPRRPAPRPEPPPSAPPSGVLERGISILECFTEERLRLQLRELAELTRLDKATLLRLLGVLVRARMMHRFDDGAYSPGPATLHLGMLYRRTFDLGSRLQPALLQVMLQTGETVAFYVRSGDERVCLYRENTSNEVRHHVEVGNRVKLDAGGSSAHVLKAFTGGSTPQAGRIATDGFAITRGERVDQMASVAIPVFEGDGSFLGALVVIGLAPRQNAAAQRRAVKVAREELAKRGFASRPPADWPGGARVPMNAEGSMRRVVVPIGVSVAAVGLAVGFASTRAAGGEPIEAAAVFAAAALVTLVCTARVLWLVWRMRAAFGSGTPESRRAARPAFVVGLAWCVAVGLVGFVAVFGIGIGIG